MTGQGFEALQGWERRYAALMNRWRTTVAPARLHEDGAVDPALYWRQPLRVVVALRQVQDLGETSFLDLLGRGARLRWRTAKGGWRSAGEAPWNHVSSWAHGLLEGFPPFTALPAATVDFRRKSLRRIAVVHWSKAGAASRKSRARLARQSATIGDLFAEQLRLLDPHVVVCAGTARILRDAFGVGDWTSVHGTRVLRTPTGPFVIDTWHPGYPVRSAAAHYARVMDPARTLFGR